ncbi:radical SAM protein [uncultured Methanolobus sp.]|uniref:radical SAM/SPASM domain-containing protein n=1 Tax=uncultured Methanolobus sp. TaxID=218300 RepID=UPI002AAC11B0|nr:radical SAM protein [uncultured Methanolobus sp.]
MALRDLTLEITRKCPMSCKLCSSNGGKPCDPEFTFEELKGIVDQAKELGVTEISLSGGEPFTSLFLSDLCKYISDLDIDVFVFTSGNYSDTTNITSPIPLDKLIKLQKSGAKKIVFSLHGSNAVIHDKITRKEGSYNNLLQSIRNAKEVDLELEVHVVPVRENYKDIPAIVDLLNCIGVESLHILRFVPQGRGETYREELELNKIEQFELNGMLNNIVANSPITITVGAHFNDFDIKTTGRCTAGTRKAVIRPDGCVYPCVGMKCLQNLSTYDVRSKNLKDIIDNSSCFVLSRNLLKEENCCLAQKLAKRDIVAIDKKTFDKKLSMKPFNACTYQLS